MFQLLMLFVDVELTIAGFDGSTQIASLLQAFESLSLNVTLPALKTNLLSSAALESESGQYLAPFIF